MPRYLIACNKDKHDGQVRLNVTGPAAGWGPSLAGRHHGLELALGQQACYVFATAYLPIFLYYLSPAAILCYHNRQARLFMTKGPGYMWSRPRPMRL
jgi:hypothetical protein